MGGVTLSLAGYTQKRGVTTVRVEFLKRDRRLPEESQKWEEVEKGVAETRAGREEGVGRGTGRRVLVLPLPAASLSHQPQQVYNSSQISIPFFPSHQEACQCSAWSPIHSDLN